MATVELRPGESQEKLLNRFRKKVQQARILSTAKKHRRFMSNSAKRRLALRKARRRERRRMHKMNQKRGYL
ncbi:MAG: 30S ribosomal protein S21 [Anaerolineae bacterium]|nr:30S ribosomal protein S21 [Anaerolineae bacterium]